MAVIALIIFLAVIAISILVTRVAAVALVHTGLSEQIARLQARSAFTGVGFTTAESEGMVSHPVRRRILHGLLLLGNAGLVTAISTLILTFVGTTGTAVLERGAVLLGGLVALVLVARSRWADRLLSRGVSWALDRWTEVRAADYSALLNLQGDFAVSRVRVNEESWLAGRTLDETELAQEGVLVLGIDGPDGDYIGAPHGRYEVEPGDVLVLYGIADRLEALGERAAGSEGDEEHERQIREHNERLRRQDRTAEMEPGAGEDGAGARRTAREGREAGR